MTAYNLNPPTFSPDPVATFKDFQTDFQGNVFINPFARIPTYTVAGTISPVSLATDVAGLTGSASKTVRVRRVRIGGSAATLTTVAAQLIKRTVANTGGTTATINIAKHDSNDSAATAVASVYTTNATTLGTGINVRSDNLSFTPSTQTSAAPLDWDFSSGAQPLTLRGTSESLWISLGGSSIPGGPFINISIDWTEEPNS
jgi:hypothetical protein